jgi:hypothetical protein
VSAQFAHELGQQFARQLHAISPFLRTVERAAGQLLWHTPIGLLLILLVVGRVLIVGVRLLAMVLTVAAAIAIVVIFRSAL